MPIACAVVVIACVFLALRQNAGSDERGYVRQVQAACKSAYEQLRAPGSGTYFDAVALVSASRLAALNGLQPPSEYAAHHRELISLETRLNDDARFFALQHPAFGRPNAERIRPDFETLRGQEAVLHHRYAAIGVRDCSN